MDERNRERGETKNRKCWGAVREMERKKINGGQVGRRMTCTRLPALRKRKSRRRKERQRE